MRNSRHPIWRTVPLGFAVAAVAAMLVLEEPVHVGVFGLVAMLALMVLKTPIALAMIVPSIAGVYAILGWPATERLLSFRAFDAASSWSLSVIPMFVFMGVLLWRSGITGDIYRAMDATATRVPGRLAVVTNLSGGVLASISGDSSATTYALGRVGIPEMLKAGYDPRLAMTSVVMAGTGGQLMPPSILMVVYAGVAGVSIGPQLMAGVGPAVVLVATYTVAIVAISAFRPRLAGGDRVLPDYSIRERLRLMFVAWPAPALVVLVLGGIYTGVVTATEAGAAGALLACAFTVWRKRREGPWRTVTRALSDAVSATAAIMFLLIGAIYLTELLRFSGIAQSLTSLVLDAELTRMQVLLVVGVMYLVLGMFMSSMAMILITVPLLMPVLAAVDVSMLWFGAYVVLLAEVGMITPPIGILTYIVHGVASEKAVNLGREITLNHVFVGVLWLMPATVLVLLLMVLFPELVTWLPERSG